MKKLILCLLVGLTYLSCKKEDVYVVADPTPKEPFKVNQVINDSTIVLTWGKFTGTHFKQYRLIRTATYQKGDMFGVFLDTIFINTDVNQTSYTENKMPLANEIRYLLYVDKDTLQPGYFPAQANYTRPNSLLACNPTDVLYSKALQKLFVTDQQKIYVVDYTSGRPVNTKQYPVGIGYCSLAFYNGSYELYVPLKDGWVDILDATTLQLKDRIYVAGFGVGSVLALNGKLYIASSDYSTGLYSNCIKVYDRATKTLITRTGYWDQTRLVTLEGTNVEMIDLTINVSPVDLSYYQFAPDGTLITKRNDTYHGTYTMNPNIVRSFPDGSRFITSAAGTIFNKSLVFDRYVAQNGTYTDFAFNSTGSVIYAANGPQKRIDIITYPATTNTGNYPTKFYPYKLFRDDNTLITISKASTSSQGAYLLIENIKL